MNKLIKGMSGLNVNITIKIELIKYIDPNRIRGFSSRQLF